MTRLDEGTFENKKQNIVNLARLLDKTPYEVWDMYFVKNDHNGVKNAINDRIAELNRQIEDMRQIMDSIGYSIDNTSNQIKDMTAIHIKRRPSIERLDMREQNQNPFPEPVNKKRPTSPIRAEDFGTGKNLEKLSSIFGFWNKDENKGNKGGKTRKQKNKSK